MKVLGNDDRVGTAGLSQDLDRADQLISDLAALVDAGLVVVHEHVLGPTRYGVAPVPIKATADERSARWSRVGIMQG